MRVAGGRGEEEEEEGRRSRRRGRRRGKGSGRPRLKIHHLARYTRCAMTGQNPCHCGPEEKQ